jgi:cell division protein FtsL
VSGLMSSLHARGVVLWVAALATGIVCVWQHVRSNQLASEIETLRNAREAVQTEIGLLEMECAELSRRERVEAYASERLGMRYPRAGEVVWLVPSPSGEAAGGRQDFVGSGTSNDTQG